MPASSSARLVQRTGLVLAAAGLLLGATVYLRASGADAAVDDLARQREMAQVERLGGTATVQTVRFDRWLSSMWEGRQLGVTLALLGLAVGGACRYVGGLMGEDVDDESN